ncbi:MAG TPA: ribulose-phosphate 3-epimerase [Firmicutes bacterium]|nr:ribulose-phosphate 3-epimerase [Bacillota bacterium]
MGKAVKIGASLLAADFSRLADEIRQVEEAGVDLLHIDVMDGDFVPNITFGPPVVAAVRKVTRLPLDVHLMIELPERFIERFVEAGADYITVHAEATPHLHRNVALIRSYGVKAGVALNPGTPVGAAEEVLGAIDLLLIMSVDPGFGGQKFIDSSFDKLERLLKRYPTASSALEIEVDGGVNAANAPRLVRSGVSILVAGSSIFGERDRVKAVKKIKDATAQE